MKITLIDHNTKGMDSMIEALGICRGKQCTETTLEQCLEAKPVPHMSVLEFGWVMVLIEGISVKAWIQHDRHRVFSPMERSTRSLNMFGEEVIIPETVKDKAWFKYELERAMWRYGLAIEKGESLEDASYLLPMAITTKFYLAGNVRTWFEYFQKRLCKKHVQDEHYRLAVEMWNVIKEKFPVIEKAYPCKACGKCGLEV